MQKTILFPYDSNSKIDNKELKKEYDSVVASNLFDVRLFCYADWKEKNKLQLDNNTNSDNVTIYRGYMMKSDEYDTFYTILNENNIHLITTPKEYSSLHIFYNIYHLIKKDTAKTLFYSFDENIDIKEIRKHFNKFMIKDYVKSLKYADFPKCLDSSISQSELNNYIAEFKRMRGHLLTGGICIKEFLDLKYYDKKTNEYRVFYMNGEIVSISRNSGQNYYTAEPPKALLEKYKKLPSPYYTVDYAELTNGEFKIIEAGDGQVSGLSINQDPGAYYRSIYHCI